MLSGYWNSARKMPNKCVKFALVPTRKSEALLLAAQSQRWA